MVLGVEVIQEYQDAAIRTLTMSVMRTLFAQKQGVYIERDI